MKRCPQCSKSYNALFEVCPDDNTPLIDIASASFDPMLGKLLAGRYRIIKKIGEGGMGAVYQAVHTKMDRICAIKLLIPLSSSHEKALARFNREAKMASRIVSSHVVTIYDFGEGEHGMLYLAMEYIDGKPLSYILAQEQKLRLERVVRITGQIAEALSAAHVLNIVHRDLKPDNIMLTHKGVDSDYVKVLDFGIAKSVAEDSADKLTKTGFVLGTPVYMSPEQLLGERLDERSDIYSLAIIVYEMLSGRLPFEGDNPKSIMMKRLTSDPIPLSQVAPSISKSVEQVVITGLMRDREARTGTVEVFASALYDAAYGLGYRTTIIKDESSYQNTKETMHDLSRAEGQERKEIKSIEGQKKGEEKDGQSQEQRSVEWPSAHLSRTMPPRSYNLPWIISIFLVLLVAGIIIVITIYRHSNRIGNQVFNTSVGQDVIPPQWQSRRALTEHSDFVNSVTFSQDSRTLASGGFDGKVILWDMQAGTLQRTLKGKRGSDYVYAVVLSPDGSLAIAGVNNDIMVWDIRTGNLQQTLSGHSKLVFSVAISPDGRTLASGSQDHSVILWDILTGVKQQTLTLHSDEVKAVAFSPDGKTLASGSYDKTIILWDVQSGAEKKRLSGHSAPVYTVAFSAEGNMLASGSEDNTIILWDAQTGAKQQTLSDHDGEVNSLAFSPNGKALASAGNDKKVILWQVGSGRVQQILLRHKAEVNAIAFSPDGKTLASGSSDKTIILWGK